ncbi:MAG: HAMP domain-containing protein [Ignavibacteriales bacterium]|nr:HAMP domain-containing protein [Ignavibacteriales bacterium]
MKSLLPNRLAFRLILFLTILIVVAEGISGFINIKTQEEQLLDAMIVGADQLSRAITSATWHAMLADSREAAYEVMQTIALKQGIDRIRIFNKEGRVMFSTTVGEAVQVDKKAEACYLCHASDQPLVKVDVPSRSRIYTGPNGVRRLAMVTPIYNEPSCSEAECHAHPKGINVLGVLDVSLDLKEVDEEIDEVERRVVLMTGIQVVLVGLFIVIFTRRFVDAPIRQLIEGTRAISAMQLDRPLDIDSNGELGELAHSFDSMRRQLLHALTELNEFTKHLETKVEERTEQLNAAHRKLLHTDRLASLGQLAASVAHEINNPISGVLNLSMLLQRIMTDTGIPPGRVDEVKRYLAQITNETSRVGRIVADLLAFSRRSKPHRAQADLNAIIRSTLSVITHKLKLMNVKVDLRLADQLPAVHCDGSQLQQVLINLIMNGAEATANKGEGLLTLSTEIDKEKTAVVLMIRDNGDGIAPEFLPKIFDPFFTTKGEGKGVGLGLAVVYGIVQAHRGDIEVKSRTGEGTTFRVSLPLTNVDEGAPETTLPGAS